MIKESKKVLVGFSGGVDSTMSAYYLQQAGFKVTAIYFKFLENKKAEKLAEQLAQKLKIELIKKDLRREFREKVINQFINSYLINETPNPCVLCNPEFKFHYLLKTAQELGISQVATGHYAQISRKAGKICLLRGVDELKDQSYFLYRLNQDQLKKIIFPLGDKKKENIVQEAISLKLKPKAKESQNACFLTTDKSAQEFLLRKIPARKGEIIDEKGIVLGWHQGAFNFTLGQRKGLGISGGPYFVIGKKENKILVSKNKLHQNIFCKEVVFNKTHWIGKEPSETKKFQAKIRYLMKGENCQLKKLGGGKWKAIFNKPVWAPARGQSLVVYEKDRVLGGGIIF